MALVHEAWLRLAGSQQQPVWNSRSHFFAAAAELMRRSNGNFYGTTGYGGVNGDGTVFEVTTNGTMTTLVSF